MIKGHNSFIRRYLSITTKILTIMKKGFLFGIAALAVGVVVYTLGNKKVKTGFYPGKAVYKY